MSRTIIVALGISPHGGARHQHLLLLHQDSTKDCRRIRHLEAIERAGHLHGEAAGGRVQPPRARHRRGVAQLVRVEGVEYHFLAANVLLGAVPLALLVPRDAEREVLARPALLLFEGLVRRQAGGGRREGGGEQVGPASRREGGV